MAAKGARAKLEPIAFRMYAEGQTLDAIAEALGVSRQSLSDWKARTRRPSEELDEWDKAREQKRSRLDRMRSMFDEQLEAMEGVSPLQRDSRMMDALAKLGALIEKWEGMEERARKQAMTEAAERVEKAAVQQGLNSEQAAFWRQQVLGVG